MRTFLGGRVELHAGDCLDVLRAIPDVSVDSVVTDPPYEIAFMGRKWDSGSRAHSVELWAEVYRVLKPGGHVLSFGGTRTYHRMACAVEDAGFEIRDMVAWLYGSGFPKSHNISKAIDRRGGERVDWFGPWLRKWRAERNIAQKDVAALFPSKTGGKTGCVANWELGLNLPTPEQFNLICQTFNLPFASMAEAEREVLGQQRQGRLAVAPGQGFDRSAVTLDITAPASEAAKQWEGWGSALKPALEPIVLARKPLIGTLAENVLAHGTGGLNVDGCRVATDENRARMNNARTNGTSYIVQREIKFIDPGGNGRWPANVVHDGSEEVVEAFPETGAASSGLRGLAGRHDPGQGADHNRIKDYSNGVRGHDDAGGSAARFFKEVKPDPPGRWPANVVHDGSDEVVEAFPETASGAGNKNTSNRDNGLTIGNGLGAGNGYGIGGDTGSAARFFYSAKAGEDDRLGSKHPTVKPVDLMQWLVRLVTPPGGTCLDPFAGTGTTAEACFREGMRAVLIEREPEHQADIERRMALVLTGPVTRRHESIKARGRLEPVGTLL